jgi:hypothetical protein
MSPLIATVLLMAFAVALAGMIMNWNPPDGRGGDCDRIDIKVSQLCTHGDKITLVMRNNQESVPLVGVKLMVTESNIESVLRIKDSALAPGQPLEVEVPASTSNQTDVIILGMIGTQANPVTCTASLADAKPIQSCDA